MKILHDSSILPTTVTLFDLTPVLTNLTTLQGIQSQEYLIGSIGVSGKTKWDVLDGVIRRLFKVNTSLLITSGQLFRHINTFFSHCDTFTRHRRKSTGLTNDINDPFHLALSTSHASVKSKCRHQAHNVVLYITAVLNLRVKEPGTC